MRADEGSVRQLVEERPHLLDRRVRAELVAHLDAQVATPRERTDALEAARVRARHDAFDRVPRERLRKLTRVGAADAVEPARPVEARRPEPFARARMSQQQQFPSKSRKGGDSRAS